MNQFPIPALGSARSWLTLLCRGLSRGLQGRRVPNQSLENLQAGLELCDLRRPPRQRLERHHEDARLVAGVEGGRAADDADAVAPERRKELLRIGPVVPE